MQDSCVLCIDRDTRWGSSFTILPTIVSIALMSNEKKSRFFTRLPDTGSPGFFLQWFLEDWLLGGEGSRLDGLMDGGWMVGGWVSDTRVLYTVRWMMDGRHWRRVTGLGVGTGTEVLEYEV